MDTRQTLSQTITTPICSPEGPFIFPESHLFPPERPTSLRPFHYRLLSHGLPASRTHCLKIKLAKITRNTQGGGDVWREKRTTLRLFPSWLSGENTTEQARVLLRPSSVNDRTCGPIRATELGIFSVGSPQPPPPHRQSPLRPQEQRRPHEPAPTAQKALLPPAAPLRGGVGDRSPDRALGWQHRGLPALTGHADGRSRRRRSRAAGARANVPRPPSPRPGPASRLASPPRSAQRQRATSPKRTWSVSSSGPRRGLRRPPPAPAGDPAPCPGGHALGGWPAPRLDQKEPKGRLKRTCHPGGS